MTTPPATDSIQPDIAETPSTVEVANKSNGRVAIPAGMLEPAARAVISNEQLDGTLSRAQGSAL